MILRALLLAVAVACLPVHATSHADDGIQRDQHGRIARSAAAKYQFQKDHPCPATGQVARPCPGHVVDHIIPLCAGGADRPENMQWQQLAESKIKDRQERQACRELKRAP